MGFRAEKMMALGFGSEASLNSEVWPRESFAFCPQSMLRIWGFFGKAVELFPCLVGRSMCYLPAESLIYLQLGSWILMQLGRW